MLLAACSSSASSDGAPTKPLYTSTRAQELCAGSPLPDAQVSGCPAPATIRHGRACELAAQSPATCPSPNFLQGECRCDGTKWACDDAQPPDGYDPYPDCPDEGVEGGGACYLEGSTCLPRAATACFTKGAALCTCTGHSWDCP